MAAGALAACFVLSIFVGQWPWSSQTIVDVEAQTYAPSAEWRRLGNSEDGKWLEGELKQIRKSQSSVLATGRIASHLIGCEHLETVGQFHERREKLQACMPANQSVLERYEWIVLDRQERFQQSKEQIEKVELEARRLGFQVEQDRYDVVFLRRSKR